MLICGISGVSQGAEGKWSKERAAEWYAGQPWLVGCNFLPSTAINQLEMWQADTFDPETIDRELGRGAAIGFNTARVFLHDLLWSEDRDGFFKRIEEFLAIADKHGIRVMFLLFDGVWDPDPQLGEQNRPRRGVHNSGWVQSPGRVVLADPRKQDLLKPYVTDLLTQFGNDSRIIVWDLFNEPDNPNSNSYGPLELNGKEQAAAQLTRKAFVWAREVSPSQPLTVGVWRGLAWNDRQGLNLVHTIALDESDVVSFHNYGGPEEMQARIRQLRTYGRPLLCTEFLARGADSTFEAILPLLKNERVAAYCWGLVDGKSQTKYPWSTWQTPLLDEPEPWHHDVFRADGSPNRREETELIEELAAE
ncbi:MAG: cellulase family glycosylhydrolase [Pirellulales bacterium]|nr:cellulase family glycosylhydrolase [Pirellulales bacterium]